MLIQMNNSAVDSGASSGGQTDVHQFARLSADDAHTEKSRRPQETEAKKPSRSPTIWAF